MRRIILIFFISALILICAAGEMLIQPAHTKIGLPPADLPTQSITLQSQNNGTISGWFVRGMPATGAVLLVHGIRSNRMQMLSRARLLYKQGYSVMLIDLPAHGESTGEKMTFGINEAEAVKTSISYLAQNYPDEKIGIIGVSLGAASTVLALAGVSPAPAAIVLESMFPSIAEAVSDRFEMQLGEWGRPLAPLLLWQLPVRLGFWADQLRPIASLSSLHVPVLIASGSKDRHTTLEETKRIFQVANSPKELWIVEGALHQDLFKFDPANYKRRISGFLGTYLRSTILAHQ
jgi:uncharacterized protein